MSETIATATTATPATAFTPDSIERKYFGPSEFAEASEYLNKIQSVLPASEIHYNTDLSKELPPEGYGLYAVPVRARNEAKKENELIGVAFYAAPTPETVMADEKGLAYVTDALFSAMAAKMANSIRPSRDGTTAKPPFSLADFIERKSRDGGFKTWNEMKKSLVEAIKVAGLKSMTVQVLRQCLSNQAIAESQAPSVSSEHWGKFLDYAAAKATANGLDPQIFTHWKETRNDATLANETFDASALDELFGEVGDDETGDDAAA